MKLRDTLKEFLQKPYESIDSFLKNVIFPVFGEDNFVSAGNGNVLRRYPDLQTIANDSGILSLIQVGYIFIDGQELNIFDIKVNSHRQLSRSRVAIQSLVRKLISTYSSAFMIFHYDTMEGRWDWRFTFCQKGASNADSTDAKRYTFLLGPSQSCRTAADNFMKIYEKIEREGELEIDDIVRAFDVEALSKEFFDKYVHFYKEYFVKYMCDEANGMRQEFITTDFDHTGLTPEQIKDKEEKPIRDYLKKLLGRLVFLQFLQKKGWMGVPVDKEWGDGNYDFLRQLFLHATPEQKDNFLDGVLEPLFTALDTKRTDDIYDTQVPGIGKVKIPYLNGGLFERDSADEPDTQFPAEYFGELLEFFYEYNFTIDENDPNDAEVGIDAEMLGKIFENLLEDNRERGTFYTPKEVVQYMCRESLIAYLQSKIKMEIAKSELREFVLTNRVELLRHVSKQLVIEALRNVKICDPAIGSGAFPMGLLRELYNCRQVLEPKTDLSILKKEIICNNIYGVDIEKGAIDIARLRFWLAIIVDADKPDPLPNFDYKFMQGNSLLEQYKGMDLSNTSTIKSEINGALQISIFEDIQDVYRNQLKGLLGKYFSCSNHVERTKLREQIANNVREQFSAANCEFECAHINPSANTEYFLWHTWFKDVFDLGGFDIYIGNPPYNGISQNNAESLRGLIDDYKKEPNSDQPLQERKHWLQDDYVKFIRVMEKLINDSGKGILCFITNSSFIDNPTFRGMRWHLMRSFNAIHILDLHGNARKNDIQTEGIKDENVFNIMQGVAIDMFIKNENSSETALFYADIVGSRKKKLSILASSHMSMTSFNSYTNTAPFYLFVPHTSAGIDKYNKGFSIPELFSLSATGVTTSRDSLVIDINKDKLLHKITVFADVSKDDIEVRQLFFGNKRAGKYLPGDTRGWKMDIARKKIQKNNHQELIIPFAFRIFDNRYIYYTPDMVDWGRENVFVNVVNKTNYCLVVPRQTSKEWRHVFVSEKVSNFNFLATGGQNGAGTFFPLYSYREKNERYYNINKDIWNKIDETIERHATGEEIFDYVYAILYSENYRTLYEGFLKMDFPKIPYPKSVSFFEQYASLGNQLRLLHLFKNIHGKCSEYEFLGMGNNLVDRVAYSNKCIYINKNQFFSNVSEKVWEKIFGDDQPLRRWLNERKGIFLSDDDIQYYKEILYVISQTIVFEDRIKSLEW